MPRHEIPLQTLPDCRNCSLKDWKYDAAGDFYECRGCLGKFSGRVMYHIVTRPSAAAIGYVTPIVTPVPKVVPPPAPETWNPFSAVR